MSKNTDVVHDLANTDYKKLIERTAGKNFKLTDCKAEFDKLFKENPHEFIEQLNRVSRNLSLVAHEYKKELDASKVDDIKQQILHLDESVKAALLASLGIKNGKAKSGTVRSTNQREIINVTVDGKMYEIKKTGNISAELKELIKSQGFDYKGEERMKFFDKFESR
ncbi:TPA: hypothetical protein L7619_005475 [Klebsiella variicola subsp. variicola]|uniref:Uncharacterized protein n=1 Tax=Citrobacter freundii TaxID=546 RepID=A0AA44NP00_CITFR|nr:MULTISPECIES: hypothetical protein [Enterobacterales]OYQ99008.1 hypothetical protein B9P90_06985 [Citrobacter freundii]OYR06335.1 hypothetical protein B9P89_06590 [Citrobacter freundii]RZA55147.1 hypothetical protein EVY46_11080 [Serratia marcescens]HBQ5898595.1 hypothetical protein [Klebsiella variicola subsp. variicola]